MTIVTLQYFDGCPHWQSLDRRLRQLAGEYEFAVTHEVITSAEQAEAVGFLGSPSMRIDGVDPFARGDESPGLACRVYDTPEGPAGAPTERQLRAALSDRPRSSRH